MEVAYYIVLPLLVLILTCLIVYGLYEALDLSFGNIAEVARAIVEKVFGA